MTAVLPTASVPPEIKAEILAEALPYIRKFHGKTIVVKYGGNAMTEERLKHGFARDVILLKLVGMNPVVVHGGGPQIDNALKKIGKQGSFVQGMRITDEETMEVVEWVLGGEVQQDIVMLINHYGGQAVGLTGKDGGLIRARKMQMPDKDNPGKFLDIGFVGEIDGINPAVVKALQDDAFIPISSPTCRPARLMRCLPMGPSPAACCRKFLLRWMRPNPVSIRCTSLTAGLNIRCCSKC